MNFQKQILKPIIEENNDLCVELTYFSDTLPAIKSYYIMSNSEYEEITSFHMDIYIENFINNETLTKDNLDIYLINNTSNMLLCKNFIEQYGNPFDILSLINAKKQSMLKSKINKNNTPNDILDSNFSDTDTSISLNSDSNSNSNSNSESAEYSEHCFKNKKTNKSTDKYIDTLTEIIDIYNKTNIIDNTKLDDIKLNKPELLKDDIINDIICSSI